MKKIPVSIVFCLVFCSLQAQFVYDYLKAADGYYKKGDYASAANYYEKYIETTKKGNKGEYNPYSPPSTAKKETTAPSTYANAIYSLAESYRQLNYPSKAEPFYKEILDNSAAQFPLARYHYATMQRALAKYSDAEREFKAFLESYTTADIYRENAERELKNLQFIQAQMQKKDLKYYTLTKAPAQLNTTGASYAPFWTGSNTLLFTSTRPDSNSAKKEYTNRLYQAAYTDGSLSDIHRADLPQDDNIHQGVVSATPDGNTMYLTRWSIKGQKKLSSLYVSNKTEKGWSKPTILESEINVEGYNTQQPFVTADGNWLFFASDRPGGQGGFDIWYAPISNHGLGNPINLGTVINTRYDEQAPFYHEASSSLIFSSNGRVGMGGYDFFQSKGKRTKTEVGSWETPLNLGYPVNSIKDDIYFTSRGSAKNMLEDVMLSSDREAACCLELFYLKKIRPLRQLTGRIVSCDPSKPLEGATISFIDTINQKTVHSQPLGSDGKYAFKMEDYQLLQMQASAPGFIPRAVQLGVPADMESESMIYPEICLVPEPPKVNATFVVENVYYDFNKAELKSESFTALDEIVRMLNTYPAMEIELSAHTDSKGSDKYNQKLSEARAKSVVAYLVSKGIDASRLKAKGYGESKPIAPNTNENGKDNPEGREKNRRTEFKVLKNE